MSFRLKTPGKTEFSRSDNTRLRLHRLSFSACFQPLDVAAETLRPDLLYNMDQACLCTLSVGL
jgi:hypothetical protein